MYDVINKKRKIIVSMILNIILIIICIVNIICDLTNYNAVINNDYKVINNLSDINKNNKFYYINLKNVQEENYKLENNNESIRIYTKIIGDKNVLILLKENTLLTNKTSVEVYNDKDIIKELNEKFNNNYYDKVLTNINYTLDIKIQLFKIYIILVIIVISILSSLVNIFKLFKLFKLRNNV